MSHGITGGIAFLCSFLLANAPLKAMECLFKFFFFKLEEIEGYFILGWATKNSRRLVRLATKHWS